MIYKKPDGSYLLDKGFGPATYHATEDGTPDEWAEADAYAQEHPDEVEDYQDIGPPPLDINQVRINTKNNLMHDMAIKRSVGFFHDKHKWQADPEAQQNLNGYLSLIQSGMTGPYIWRDADNINHELTSQEIVELAGAMMRFIQSLYIVVWETKAKIDNAASVDEINGIIATAWANV